MRCPGWSHGAIVAAVVAATIGTMRWSPVFRGPVASWIAHGLTLLSHILLFQDGLLSGDSILVIVEKLATKEEGKLGIVSLFILRHLLKFGPIASYELSQFVDNVS